MTDPWNEEPVNYGPEVSEPPRGQDDLTAGDYSLTIGCIAFAFLPIVIIFLINGVIA